MAVGRIHATGEGEEQGPCSPATSPWGELTVAWTDRRADTFFCVFFVFLRIICLLCEMMYKIERDDWARGENRRDSFGELIHTRS